MPSPGVDDVLITAELASRPSPSPDYEAESRALGILAEEMATNPRGVLQKCAELVMALCHADSAGVSILEPGGTSGLLRWQAAAGEFAPNLHGTMPREASPCGTVIERDSVLLFSEAERVFPALRDVEPRIYENLLAPWHVKGHAVGTLWAIKHAPEERFDAEDARVLQSLARFAATAFQMISALDEATAERSALHASEQQLRDVLESMSEGFALFDPNFTILDVNAETLRLDGRTRDELVGRNHWEAFPGSEASPQGQMFKRVMRDRVPEAMEHSYRWPDGRAMWLDTRAYPTTHGNIAIQWRDITDRKLAEVALRESGERQRVLVGELQHRTRNLMGVIRSTADKTARTSHDFADFRTRFRVRLDAMARVQGLLSRLKNADRVAFEELIEAEVAAMHGGAERIRLEGPKGIRLRSSTVQVLAMALHELATNAVKYGAIGQPQGRLAVTWSFERSGPGGKPWLHIDWRESEVAMPPPGAAPKGSGQGRELIEQALPYQLQARTTYELGPDGVHCTISIPVSESSDPSEVFND